MYLNPLNENQSPQIQPIISEKVKPDPTGDLMSGNELSESEDEPAPVCEGDVFADRKEVLNALEEAYKRTKNLQVKLLNFAKKKIIEEMGKKADERLTAEDIVSEAIYRISIGKRKWYKDRVEKIENLILMVIVSLIRIESSKRPDEDNPLYNDYEAGIEPKAKKNNNPRIFNLNYYKDKDDTLQKNNIIDTEDARSKGLEKCEDEFNFEQLSFGDYIDQIERLTEEDDNEFFVLEEILNGNKSNINIAEKLNITVKDVENARKRIKRKVFKLNFN